MEQFPHCSDSSSISHLSGMPALHRRCVVKFWNDTHPSPTLSDDDSPMKRYGRGHFPVKHPCWVDSLSQPRDDLISVLLLRISFQNSESQYLSKFVASPALSLDQEKCVEHSARTQQHHGDGSRSGGTIAS